jgi:hypothetical protein
MRLGPQGNQWLSKEAAKRYVIVDVVVGFFYELG